MPTVLKGLWYALSSADTAFCAPLVLEAGAPVNAESNTGTPLIAAARHGNSALLSFLLEHGADPTVSNTRDGTPLHCAAQQGHTDCVRVLLKHGVKADILDMQKATPLVCAAKGASSKCMRMLLDAGADPLSDNARFALANAAGNPDIGCLQILIDRGVEINPPLEPRRKTPLFEAASKGLIDHMKLLLRLGADPKEECALGNALHGAAQSGVVECVKLLLDLGVQADLKSSKTRTTPLMQAASAGSIEVVNLLLQHGANPNMKSRVASIEILATLICHGADPEHFDPFQLSHRLPCFPLALLLILCGFDHRYVPNAFGRFRVQPMARVLGVNVFQQLEEGNSILRYHEGQVHRHCFQHTKEELDALVAKCCTLMDSHSDVGL
eukprot:m.278060 g.278060  ORF g.278060 m.278060 type:complete len:383 (+) comp15735_c0_seq11:829-1977(+)